MELSFELKKTELSKLLMALYEGCEQEAHIEHIEIYQKMDRAVFGVTVVSDSASLIQQVVEVTRPKTINDLKCECENARNAAAVAHAIAHMPTLECKPIIIRPYHTMGIISTFKGAGADEAVNHADK